MAASDREIVKRQIRDAVDIVDLVGSYVTLRRAGATFKGLCPFHEEKTPSFTVSQLRQTFKCFGCGAGGDVFSFVQLKENLSFPEAMRMLAERAGISLELHADRGQSGPGKQDIAQANQWAQQVFRQSYNGPQGQAAREYVSRRGLSAEMVEMFGLGLALDSFDSIIVRAQADRIALPLLEAAGLIKRNTRGGLIDTFRNRLMFPIVDATGRIIGFGGRTMGDDPAKYLNSPATALFDKSASLFGLNLARQAMATAGRAIVVEGYTDCMMAHQFGFTETIATLGTAMTDAHATLLRRYTDRVVLLFDSDQAGQKAADRAISVALTSGLDVELARVPQGKDPCDYLLLEGREGMDSVLKQGIGALEFKWNLLAQEYDASGSGPGRRRAIDSYVQQLAGWLNRGVIDPIQKGLLVNQLSKILGVPTQELYRQLDVLAQRMIRPTNRAAEGMRSISGGDAVRSEPSSTNAEQRALRQIIEVLLNEPTFFPAVEPFFEPHCIQDRATAAIGMELVGMLRGGEPFQISELIGRFESPEYGQLVVDLATRGEQRAGYAATIEGAVACLKNWQLDHLSAAIESAADANEDEKLLALGDRARNPRFGGLRARKKFM